ncbi:hypothetical protein BC831DRAFT_217770 [Entophlyctis helioformis]|nr:hypothetical protein BC831DRAFT_217770 [Entophlyctis helioformis]
MHEQHRVVYGRISSVAVSLSSPQCLCPLSIWPLCVVAILTSIHLLRVVSCAVCCDCRLDACISDCPVLVERLSACPAASRAVSLGTCRLIALPDTAGTARPASRGAAMICRGVSGSVAAGDAAVDGVMSLVAGVCRCRECLVRVADAAVGRTYTAFGSAVTASPHAALPPPHTACSDACLSQLQSVPDVRLVMANLRLFHGQPGGSGWMRARRKSTSAAVDAAMLLLMRWRLDAGMDAGC